MRTQLLSTRNPLAFGAEHWPKVNKGRLLIFFKFISGLKSKTKRKKRLNSHAGNQTRAAALRTPNLDH